MEEDEYVDKSQWLPLKVVKQYADYAVKNGRKEYNNGSILSSKKDKPTIDRLHEDEKIPDSEGNPTSLPILEGYHRDAGLSFKSLCDCAEGRISAATYIDGTPAPIDPALKRAAIYRQLSQRQAYYVDRILFGTVREGDYPWLRQCYSTISDAFEGLFQSMKPENVNKAIDHIVQINIDKRKTAPKV